MNILALLSGNPAAAATAPAFNSQMSPEANAFIGARPAAPAVESFQRPKGLRNTIGQIADALAIMGGQTPGYSTALNQQEATFVKKQKENALADYLNNPNDSAAMQRFQTVAPVEALEVITKLTPKPQNPGSVSDFQFALKMKAELPPNDPRMPQIDAYLAKVGTPTAAPRVVGGANDQFVLGPDNQPIPLGIGTNRAPPAPQQPRTDVVEINGRKVLIDLNTGSPIRDLGATGKGGGTSTDPAKGGALGSTIGDIRKLYQDLNRVGGMVDPKAGVVSNLRARAANSGPGQLVAGALGTEAQTIRDQLASALPALMQQVKQATGMTAAQVNSIPEMRLLQDQVTNPTRSYPAVAATLDAIEKRYLGGGKPTAPATGGFKVVGKRKQQ